MCLSVLILIKKIVLPCRLVKQVLNVIIGKAWIGVEGMLGLCVRAIVIVPLEYTSKNMLQLPIWSVQNVLVALNR